MKWKLINNPPCASPLLMSILFWVFFLVGGGGCVSNCMFSFYNSITIREEKKGENMCFVMEINIYILIPVNISFFH